jgi:hypothetical protein
MTRFAAGISSCLIGRIVIMDLDFTTTFSNGHPVAEN